MARSRHTAAVLRIAWVAIYILVAVLLTARGANAGDVSRSGIGHVCLSCVRIPMLRVTGGFSLLRTGRWEWGLLLLLRGGSRC